MKPDVVIHQAEEGGNRVEVPSIPKCTFQGDCIEKLLQNVNVHEAVAGCLYGHARPIQG